jgi:beta-lactamase class A
MLGSMGVGYRLHGLRQPDIADGQSYEIRSGSGGLTNPLLDCEVAGYRRGRELRPFKREIEALVDRLIAGRAAERISLYFRDLDNGPFFGIREEEGFTGASLLKVPTVMAALLQTEDSPGFLARVVRFEGYPDEDSPGQYVPEQRLVRGQGYPVDQLLLRAAAYSDNAAVGVLNRLVGPAYIARVYRELDVPRPPPDQPAARSITPLGYGRLFRVLYNASFLDRPLSERALSYFAASSFHAGLEAGVPAGTTVAHKFGIYWIPGRTATAQLHDCGIVYRPGRPYFLCVMTEGRDVDALAEAIRQISREVFLAIDTQSEPFPGVGVEPLR